MASLSEDEAIEKLFTLTLDALAAIDAFSDSTTPTSFIVYAHDPDGGGDGLGPAYSESVKRFIDWMHRVQTRTYSDRHSSGTFAHEIRSNGDLAIRDILGNQFCLLPRKATAAGIVPVCIDRVETVIVFGSPRLRSYCQHPFAESYINAIKKIYAQCGTDGDAELRQRLQQDLLRTETGQPGFHHILTELAFLELRRQHNPETHGIILASFEKDVIDYLKFTEPTNLQVNIDASSSPGMLHDRFFKLLRVVYPRQHADIDTYERAYRGARTQFHDQKEHLGDEPDLYTLIEKFISGARRDLANYKNTELRQLERKLFLGKLGSAERDAYDQRRNQVLGKLPTVPYEDRKDRNPERVEGTCLWFTHHQTFKDWHASKTGKILLVTAYPGCGKSVLLKHLVDTVLVATNTSVCYFFFKDDFEDQKSIVGALRCLLHQLLLQRPELFTDKILQTFEQNHQLTSSISNLWEMLGDIARTIQTGTVILVLDALDECAREDRRTFLELLVKWNEDGACTRVKFLVSSRPYQDILRGIHPIITEIHLAAEKDSTLEEISREIDLVILHNIRRTVAYQELEPQQQDLLRQELTKVPNKTYLWAHLVQSEIDEVVEADSQFLREAVQRLPQSVEKAYEKILNKGGDPRRVKRMLSIILAASEPLNLRQLAQAWAITPSAKSQDELHILSPRQLEATIRGLCGLFVIVVEGKVYFLHQTAREFLLGECVSPITMGTGDRLWQGSIGEAEANLVMAKICMQYFLLYGTHAWMFCLLEPIPRAAFAEDCTICQRLPGRGDRRCGCFVAYAIEQWHSHVLRGREAGGERLVQEAAILCGQFSQVLLSSKELRENRSRRHIEEPKKGQSFVARRLPTPLPLVTASMLGLLPVVELLLQSPDAELENADHDGTTAVGWAVRCRHADVACFLLDRGADANTKIQGSGPVLSWAANRRDCAVAAKLLANGADPNAVDFAGATALMVASQAGATEAVSLLLQHGANIEAVGGWRGSTALGYACTVQRAETAHVLLNAGADPSIADTDGRTPLMQVCEEVTSGDDHDQLQLIKRLLGQCPTNVNARDHRGATVLAAVSRRGSVIAVQMLLDAEADINTVNNKGKTPLMRAVKRGHTHVVEVLLSHKADTECVDTKARTALSLAAYNGSVQLVQMLVSCGAQVIHNDNQAISALISAADRGHVDIVTSLLKAGADINAVNEYGETPLITAVHGGHTQVVEVLLTYQPNAECVDNQGRAALSIAADNDSIQLVQMLLGYGATADHNDNHAESALVIAAQRGSVDIVTILLEAGADPARPDSNGWHALTIAASCGHLKIVELLLPKTEDLELVKDALHEVHKRRRKAIRTALSTRIYELQWQADPVNPFRQHGIFKRVQASHSQTALSHVGIGVSRSYY